MAEEEEGVKWVEVDVTPLAEAVNVRWAVDALDALLASAEDIEYKVVLGDCVDVGWYYCDEKWKEYWHGCEEEDEEECLLRYAEEVGASAVVKLVAGDDFAYALVWAKDP